jgi:methionyl-tRNA formyltransferase
MGNKPLKIGVILQPSIRGMAYMDTFREMNICPEKIILMPGSIGKLAEVRAEDKFGYSGRFFDLQYGLFDYVRNCGADVKTVSSGDINSIEIRNALESCSAEYIVFTGGGILGLDILSIGKKFIHVHPGILPEYRGSTCFYYSLLEKGTVAATAFIMEEGIDTGRTIFSAEFRVNYKIHPEQSLFMDFVLDPYIRAFTLKKVLGIYLGSGTIPTYPQQPSSKPAYYVMHPLLRHIAVHKINRMFDGTSAIGIYVIKEGK